MTEKKLEAPPKPLAVIDSANVPDVFASWAQGFSRRHGNIHISFAVDRYIHETKEPKLVVIGRLILPIEGALDLVKGLGDFLKSVGIDPDAAPAPQSPRTLQ